MEFIDFTDNQENLETKRKPEIQPNDPVMMKDARKCSYFSDAFQEAKLTADEKVKCIKMLADKLRIKETITV